MSSEGMLRHRYGFESNRGRPPSDRDKKVKTEGLEDSSIGEEVWKETDGAGDFLSLEAREPVK